MITPPVERLRDELGLPGMVVLQFGFDPQDPMSPHRFRNHAENRFVYTGTHDHDTARGLLRVAAGGVAGAARRRPRRRGDRRARAVVGADPLALALPAPRGDDAGPGLLGLGSEARMNDPGRRGGNWRWRLEPRRSTPALARRLRELRRRGGRSGGVPRLGGASASQRA